MMQIHSCSQNYPPPPVTRVTFLYLETLEILFEKNFLNKKFSLLLNNILATFFCRTETPSIWKSIYSVKSNDELKIKLFA